MDITNLVNKDVNRKAHHSHSAASNSSSKEVNQHKPFQCTYGNCTKAFARRSDLQRHLRIHLNERCVLLHIDIPR